MSVALAFLAAIVAAIAAVAAILLLSGMTRIKSKEG